MLEIIILVLLGLIIIKLLMSDGGTNAKLMKIKAVPSYPIVGHALSMGKSTADIFSSLYKMWNTLGRGTFRIQLGNVNMVMLTTPDCIEKILSSNDILDKQKESYNFLIPWLGTGLLTSTGAKWHSRRKILTPAFHFKILEKYVDIFQRGADSLVEKLIIHPENADVNIQPYISKCALQAICETAMGINIEEEKNIPYVNAIEEICRIIHLRIFSFFIRSDFVFNLTADGRTHKKCLDIINRQTDSVLECRKIELKDEISRAMSGSIGENSEQEMLGIKKRLAFLDILLLSKTADGKPLEDADIREEVNTFMFEGHDTTASCLSFTIMCLSKNPEVQEKVFQEQLAVSSGDLSKPASYKEVHEMKYLDQVIKETLRMFPSVPMYGRSLNKDVTLPDGTELPKGAMVTVFEFLLTRNPEFFPDPDRFNPDRFSVETKRNPFSYVPFSAGPRNCIGQKFAMLELKCILSTIVRRLEILPSPGFEPVLNAEITLKSANGILVRFRRRT